MEIVDANVVLRYLLNDQKEQYGIAKKIIEKRTVFLPTEVLAEVVYVFEKVYNIPKHKISDTLSALLLYPNIGVTNRDVCFESLNVYNEENLDFVDAILVAYNRINNDMIHTFDKKLLKLCVQNSKS